MTGQMNDLKYLYYGGGTDAEYAAMLAASIAGSTVAHPVYVGATAAEVMVAAKVTGDTVNRFILGADGKMQWGPGNGAADVILYRISPGKIQTDGSFNAGTSVNATTDITARATTTGGVFMGAVGGSGEGGFAFGTGNDARIFRSAAEELTMPRLKFKAAEASATASAGGGAAVPATVAGFFIITDSGGTSRKVPYFAT